MSGVVEAEDLDRAIKRVMDLGYIPIDVNLQAKEAGEKKEKDLKQIFTFKRRVPSSVLTLFTRYMCDLVDASVPILRSIQLTNDQIRHPEFKTVVDDIYASVRDGSSFAESLEKHPEVFSKLYTNMVRSGELSGKLGLVLSRLAYLLEKEQETKGKVTSSLAYPVLVLLVGIATIFVLLTFIIPKVAVLFEDFNQDLPFITIVLLKLSDFFASFWWIFVLTAGLGIFYFQKTISTEKGRLWFDDLKLRAPLLGPFIQDVEIGRFSRILGTLLESGITIVTALNSVWAVLDNEVLRKEIKKAAEEVTNGASLSLALKQCPHFPELAVSMISVGEETGFLDKSLYKLAETYERQSENTVKTILSLLGPMVLILVVGIVGVFVVALLLPILRMNLVVQ